MDPSSNNDEREARGAPSLAPAQGAPYNVPPALFSPYLDFCFLSGPHTEHLTLYSLNDDDSASTSPNFSSFADLCLTKERATVSILNDFVSLDLELHTRIIEDLLLALVPKSIKAVLLFTRHFFAVSPELSIPQLSFFLHFSTILS
jgi:hypothetical protein